MKNHHKLPESTILVFKIHYNEILNRNYRELPPSTIEVLNRNYGILQGNHGKVPERTIGVFKK